MPSIPSDRPVLDTEQAINDYALAVLKTGDIQLEINELRACDQALNHLVRDDKATSDHHFAKLADDLERLHTSLHIIRD